MRSTLINRKKKVYNHGYLQRTLLHPVKFFMNMDVVFYVPCQPTHLCFVHVLQPRHSGHIFSHVCERDGSCIFQFHVSTHMTQHIIPLKLYIDFPSLTGKTYWFSSLTLPFSLFVFLVRTSKALFRSEVIITGTFLFRFPAIFTMSTLQRKNIYNCLIVNYHAPQ